MSQLGGPIVGHPSVSMPLSEPASHVPHHLQQVSLPQYIPGITNHHILSVSIFNKDQVSQASKKTIKKGKDSDLLCVGLWLMPLDKYGRDSWSWGWNIVFQKGNRMCQEEQKMIISSRNYFTYDHEAQKTIYNSTILHIPLQSLTLAIQFAPTNSNIMKAIAELYWYTCVK